MKKIKIQNHSKLHKYSPRGVVALNIFLHEASESLFVLPVVKYSSLLHFIN